MPEYLRALQGFSENDDFTSPSRLNENCVRYVAEPSGNLGYFWRATVENPRPITIHEGVPGHYFQLCLSWKHEDPIRRHYYASTANEGIGFYAEEMMLQAGLFDDSLHTREIIYNFMRLRALRVEVDVKLALGEFTLEQAAKYLEEKVPMDPETARQEAIAFATGPGGEISYQIGKLQIVKFLADARLQQGGNFNLRAFHDFVWKNGNVPISLQRWEYLGFFFSSRRRHTRFDCDWSSDVCSSDLAARQECRSAGTPATRKGIEYQLIRQRKAADQGGQYGYRLLRGMQLIAAVGHAHHEIGRASCRERV